MSDKQNTGYGFSPLRVVIKRIAEPSDATPPSVEPLRQAEDAANFWRQVIEREPTYEAEKESLYVIHLDGRRKPISFHCVTVGTLSHTLAHPREIFRAAILEGAFEIIVMHNHPSGTSQPSQADHLVTKTIKEAAKIIEINLLDHVIMGRFTFYSFKEEGDL